MIAVYGQSIKSMEFHNQEITDILLVLAESSGMSIIPDETVSGKASFYFSDSTLEKALDSFLATYKLYYEKTDSYISVSKIKVSYDSISSLASVKADDVSVEAIIRKLSKRIGKTILYDSLPASLISLDIEGLPVDEILQICIKKLPDYSLEKTDSYYYIKKFSEKNNSVQQKNKDEILTKSGNLYTLDLEKGRFLEILMKLFTLENVEYSIFVQTDVQIENLHFNDKDFDTMLHLLLEHGNADCVVKNGIFYIIDLQKKGVAAKLKTTEIISLKWIQAQDITAFIPADLSSAASMRIDKNSNSVFLTGTQEEISLLKDFIGQVDVPLGGMRYKKVEIKYLDAKDAINLIPAKIIQVQPVIIPNTNSILVCGTEETLSALDEFLGSIDIKKTGSPIKLKYIQVETLLKNLPPSISKESIIDTGYPNLIFYTGTEENKKLFLHELNMIDKPQPQIKYQLLVIQYTKGKASSLKPTYKAFPTEEGKEQNIAFSGELSNIMNLNFDVISQFGYTFAVNLNTLISNNTANVFTDTTLTALSGQEIKFQNTDTYRYIEYEYDSSGNSTTRSSVTQQITSGLIVSLNGWVSGDDMITMSVNATVSKQNSDSGTASTTLTSLPSTSERVVTTQVRTMSGEPIVISGLIKEEESEIESKTPIVGSIPVIKKLFNHKTTSKEKTEIVIYIVPHLIQDGGSYNNDSLNIERYYQEFISK